MTARPCMRGLLAAEMGKLLGRPWLMWAALAPGVAVIARGAWLRLEETQAALAAGGIEAGEPTRTAFSLAAEALRTGGLVAAIIVAIAGALALAEERRLGTLRTILAGPVRRWQFFMAKLAGLLFLTVILVGSAGFVALVAGALLGDYVALDEWRHIDLTLRGMWRILITAILLTAAAVLAVGCLALLCSTLTSSGSAGLILLLTVVLVLLGAGSLDEAVAAFSPLTYVVRPAVYVGEQVSAIGASSWCGLLFPQELIQWEARVPWIVTSLWGLLFGGLGLGIFTRRDIL